MKIWAGKGGNFWENADLTRQNGGFMTFHEGFYEDLACKFTV